MPNNNSEIFHNQVSILHKQQPPLIAGIFLVGNMLAYILWGHADNGLILGWLAVVDIYIAIRLVRLWCYHQKKNSADFKPSYWAWEIGIASVFSGCLWGCSAFLFIDFNDPVYAAVIIVMLASMIAGCLASSSVFPPAYIGFAVPCTLLSALALIIEPAEGSNYLAMLAVGFMLINLVYCRNFYFTIKDSIRLRLEHVSLLEQLSIEKEHAESANISKSKFLAAASHDLRQPVHALSIFTDALKNMQDTPMGVKNLSDKISRSVLGLRSLFDSLLDISKLDAETVDINQEHYNIKTQCEDLLASLKPQAIGKGLALTMDLALISYHCIVVSDQILVGRILSNLLTNAINYTDAGSVTVMITEHDESIRISVIDTGKGIPDKDIDNIFDEYHQLHNPERDRNKGLGLGLSICRRLAKLLQTEIAVDSLVDQGTTFSFELPKGMIEQITPERQTSLSAAASFLSQRRILLIDDEQDIREAMTTLLQQWGCTDLLCAADQFEACDLVQTQGKPDVIISDYRLPNNRTGIEAVHSLYKTMNQSIPTLLITGDTGPQAMKAIKQSGLLLLHKPVAPAKLKLALNTLLEQ